MVNLRDTNLIFNTVTPVNLESFRTILGIRFFTGMVSDALELAKRGGLVLAPSGPGLADLPHDRSYQEALRDCEVAITDSGLMVLCWWFWKRERLERISGLRFLKHFLDEEDLRRENASFWVMPSEEAGKTNRDWLRRRGIPVKESDCYTAPMYSSERVVDGELKSILEKKKPRYIVINIGGGIQEKLGCYLKKNLSYRPTIICTGAAIAFLTGKQATIPGWADRLLLGWLIRCLKSPLRFVPRYWRAGRLFWAMFRFGERSPARARTRFQDERRMGQDRTGVRISLPSTPPFAPSLSSD